MAKACGFFIIILFSVVLNLPANAQKAETKKAASLITNRDTLKMTSNHEDSLANYRRDSIRRAILVDVMRTRAKLMDIDSLKAFIKQTKIDTFKAPLYTELASRYLSYDTIVNTEQRQAYQKEGLNYSLLALHTYSAYNDSIGLRTSFDGMAKVYLSQKKYSQAKWFILQSNTISRAKNDVPNMIASLLTLAEIQSGTKDFQLTQGNLDEAMQLSIKYQYLKIQLEILKKYALLYSRMKNYPKEAIMLKKYDSLAKKIQNDEARALIVKNAKDNTLKKKKQDSLQSKKKTLSVISRKLAKS